MADSVEILSAFAKIFADQSAFDKQLAALAPQAATAGEKASTAFADAFGSQASDKTLADLRAQMDTINQDVAKLGGGAEIGASFDLLGKSLKEGTQQTEQYKIGVRDAAGTVKILGTSILGELNPALGQGANVALDATRNLKDLGIGIAAGGAAAALAAIAIGQYVAKIKEGIEATVALAQAQARGDFGAVQQQAQGTADALVRQAATGKIATQQITELNDASEVIVAFWDNFFGPSADKLSKRLDTQRAAAEKLFFQFEAPKQQLQAVVEAQQVAARGASLALETAGSQADVARATDDLVAAKRREAEATRDLILLEEARIGLDLKNKVITQAVAEERLAQIRARASNVIKDADAEEQRIRREQARRVADQTAAEIEGQAKVDAAQRQRVETVRSTVQTIAGLEDQTTRAIGASFAQRRRFIEDNRAAELAALQAETGARKAAIEARLQGATGDARAQLERDLTQVTEEETTKRLQIEADALTKRIQAAEQERQARIQQAETVLGIARTLGTRRIQDEVQTQAEIARAAEAGSQAQLAALQRVAQAQAQIQQQARGLAGQALQVADQARQAAGVGPAEFVSKASLQRDLDAQKRRDEEVRRRFEAGGTVRAGEFQSAIGNQGFFEQFKDFGNQIGQVFRDATTPIKDAFDQAIGPTLAAQFAGLTDQAAASLAGLVTGFRDAFAQIETLVGGAMDAIVARVESGASNIVLAISRKVEDELARSLADAARRV